MKNRAFFVIYIFLWTLIPTVFAEEKKEEVDEPDAVEFSAKDVWDDAIFDREDHKVLVIQDRKYTKSKKLLLGLNLDLYQNTPYLDSIGFGGNAAYFFNEYYGLEIFGNFYSNSDSKEGGRLSDFLKDGSFTSELESPQPEFLMAAQFLWNPIYGKFAFFNSNIIHFDIYASAGVSYLSTSSNITEQKGSNPNTKGTDQDIIGGIAGLGMRVFIDKWIVWRFDVRNNIFQYEFAALTNSGSNSSRSSSWLNRWQFSTGVSFLLDLGGY